VGQGGHETVELTRDKHGEDVAVMSIGPAGEKLVRFACSINADDRASGRGGTGAVGGSKNLKCIVIVEGQPLDPLSLTLDALGQPDSLPLEMRAILRGDLPPHSPGEASTGSGGAWRGKLGMGFATSAFWVYGGAGAGFSEPGPGGSPAWPGYL